MADLSGEPDPTLLCPAEYGAAANHDDESVYEAQVEKGEPVCGFDGFPLCCACGGELSEHVARVVDMTDSVNREQDERLAKLHADPSMTEDELRYSTGAEQDTHWRAQIRQVAEGRHPDPARFAASVERLTRIAWTFADMLDAADALGDVDAKTYHEYLWFFVRPENMEG